MCQAYSVITHAGDGLDHEVLDSDITAAIKAGTHVGYPALCALRVIPESDLTNRGGRRCADCLDARATFDPPLWARTEPRDLVLARCVEEQIRPLDACNVQLLVSDK